MAEFRRTGIGWEIGKLRRHYEEWWETVTPATAVEPNSYFLPPWLPQFLTFLAWVLLLVSFAWLGLKLYRWGCNYWLERQRHNLTVNTFVVSQPSLGELLRTVEFNWRRGDYRSACRYLYLALLQFLHDRDILPQDPSRTDGEYRLFLQQKRLQPLAAFFTIINLHERLHFSHAPVSEQEFIDCKTAFDRVTGQL
ncbi:MAG: DUF4129 domain-containing protein [Pseudanabaenaceae cyanobacterium]